MLDHLLAPAYGAAPLDIEPLNVAASSFVPAKDATPGELLNGKVNTAEWLRSIGAEDPTPVHAPYEAALAAQAFGSVTSSAPTLSPEAKKEHVMALRTPESVKRVVGMLTAYEWSFVEQAQNLRSYIVSGLVEETKNPKADIRLKAYKMLGEVTEVALFTTRVETVTRDLSDAQIQEEINKRLDRLAFDPTPMAEEVPPALRFPPKTDPEVDDVEPL